MLHFFPRTELLSEPSEPCQTTKRFTQIVKIAGSVQIVVKIEAVVIT